MTTKKLDYTKCLDCKTKIYEDNLWFAYATTIGCPHCEIKMGKELNWIHAIGRTLEYNNRTKEISIAKVKEAIHEILYDKFCDDKGNQEHRLLRKLFDDKKK
jgi:hypothetical protein